VADTVHGGRGSAVRGVSGGFGEEKKGKGGRKREADQTSRGGRWYTSIRRGSPGVVNLDREGEGGRSLKSLARQRLAAGPPGDCVSGDKVVDRGKSRPGVEGGRGEGSNSESGKFKLGWVWHSFV